MVDCSGFQRPRDVSDAFARSGLVRSGEGY